jgi:hypothetical protein
VERVANSYRVTWNEEVLDRFAFDTPNMVEYDRRVEPREVFESWDQYTSLMGLVSTGTPDNMSKLEKQALRVPVDQGKGVR